MADCACDSIGKLRHRVTIEKPNPSATADAAGHIDLSDNANWIPVASRKANILTRGGSEKWRFNQVTAEVTRMFQLRSDPATRRIQPRWRIKWFQDGTAKYADIATAFDVDGAKKIVEVHCTEVV